MTVTDREMLEQMRQPYRTPSERGADRRARAQEGLSNTQFERPDDAPELGVRLNVWRICRQAKPEEVAYVRCPSRSGAKIFMNNKHGWSGPFYTEIATDETISSGVHVYDAVFETVPEFAARMEAEKKERGR